MQDSGKSMATDMLVRATSDLLSLAFVYLGDEQHCKN